ncbi:hypothetical protein [Asanoa ishikariensis]|uniref:hypothetical protein n=1 Tax=Asanoa ishikariensis TaxID=137265 RepID=UPI00115FB566|nr:hypothetical protein [Asanoa ishikariensis]
MTIKPYSARRAGWYGSPSRGSRAALIGGVAPEAVASSQGRTRRPRKDRMSRKAPERLDPGGPEQRRVGHSAPAPVDARVALLAAWRETTLRGRVDHCIHLRPSAPAAQHWLTWLPGGLFCGPCARQLGPAIKITCDLCGRGPSTAYWLLVPSTIETGANDRAATTIVAMLCQTCLMS